MRTKEAILKDAGISSIGMMSELELEVLVDIRDILAKTSASTVNLKVDSDPLSLTDILKEATKRRKPCTEHDL